MKTITYHAHDTGIPDGEAEQYRAFVLAYIKREFPDCEVIVTGEQHANNVRTDTGADDYADLDRLQQTIFAAFDAYGRDGK